MRFLLSVTLFFNLNSSVLLPTWKIESRLAETFSYFRLGCTYFFGERANDLFHILFYDKILVGTIKVSQKSGERVCGEDLVGKNLVVCV